MRYNLSYKDVKTKAFKKLSEYSENGKIIELSLVKFTRSALQNRALHLYFKLVADELVSVGYDFHYTNPFTGEITPLPYTKDRVKEYIWRPLQESLTGKTSTKDIKTEDINLILEALEIWFPKIGVFVKFPNKFDLLIKQLNEYEKTH